MSIENWLDEDCYTATQSHNLEAESLFTELQSTSTSIACPTVTSNTMSTEQWKDIIIKNGGDILNKYEKLGLMPNTERKQLVNITCAKLVEMYGLKVPEFAKRNLGEAIINIFPSLRDPTGKYGYEAFYSNNNGGEGYLSWRLRTIARTTYKKEGPKRKQKNDLQNEPPAKITKIIEKTQEISDAIEFLKHVDKNELDVIYQKMDFTYKYRKGLGDIILKEFPRFFDVPSLLERDFLIEFPNKVNFEDRFTADLDKILNIYDYTVKNPLLDIQKSSPLNEPGWDKTTRAALAILYMLPPTPNRQNKENNHLSPIDRFIVFKNNNIPLEEVISKKRTSQPIIVAQGSNKGAITQYNIILDNKIIPCPRFCSSAKAIQCLFMSHFVFSLEYDEYLKHFWRFIQTYYFEIDAEKIIYTPKMIELRTRLTHFKVPV
ncbi:unnamed protein product [Brassicogethes aeneus]|uniref:Uncharacterized protein n=1 Tax=Brassicogethes aeneus TaxID=1431903 RepID=A0A9P0B0Y0_BRAAE|nr:unnamed protein product [Brassicogethes aeneus]